MKRRWQLVLAALLLGGASASLAADLAAGAAKAKEVCQACHGLDGNSQVPDYPKLGGQRSDYLAKALRDYKSGARKNAIMAGFAGTLSAADIDNVAAYYASQPPVLVVKH
ncbi:MAG TPA: cytochrome c [Casimicrobiaceae bacterium]|nr:cytochrome c [Casimicrobiaceae bacterium]